ncbi:uncharacterized protein EI97DRAFT_488628 [Westerdykella ornata]|uniref:Uncharacterized protein n=1 Tax=Westerdykella ornata TaxID=318751 RepID=A0A6A6JLE8_WESOR|nr:uncharacterized protein EI97DRAFT_488628 [Westerdykella ornata]KAF2277327.1 hypothetical protein EI97DRAFT_488628 [Westerdykella ornata]
MNEVPDETERVLQDGENIHSLGVAQPGPTIGSMEFFSESDSHNGSSRSEIFYEAAEKIDTSQLTDRSDEEGDRQNTTSTPLATATYVRSFVTPISVYDFALLPGNTVKATETIHRTARFGFSTRETVVAAGSLRREEHACVQSIKPSVDDAKPTESNKAMNAPTVVQSVEEDTGTNTGLTTQNGAEKNKNNVASSSHSRRYRTADASLIDYLTPATPPPTRLRSGREIASEPPVPANAQPVHARQPQVKALAGLRRTADNSLIDYLTPAIPPTTRLRSGKTPTVETPNTAAFWSVLTKKRTVKMTESSHVRSDRRHSLPHSQVVGEPQGLVTFEDQQPGDDLGHSQYAEGEKRTSAAILNPGSPRREDERHLSLQPEPEIHKQSTNLEKPSKALVVKFKLPSSSVPNPPPHPDTTLSPNPKPSLIVKLKLDPDLLTGLALQEERRKRLKRGSELQSVPESSFIDDQNTRKRKHSSPDNARSGAKAGANKVIAGRAAARPKEIKRRRQGSAAEGLRPCLHGGREAKVRNIPDEGDETESQSEFSGEDMHPATGDDSFLDETAFVDLTSRRSSPTKIHTSKTSRPFRIPLPRFPVLPKQQHNALAHFTQGVCNALENIIEDYHHAVAAEEEDGEDDDEGGTPDINILDIVDNLEDSVPEFETPRNYYDYRLVVVKGCEWVYAAVRKVLREVQMDVEESEDGRSETGVLCNEGPSVEEVCAIVEEGFWRARARVERRMGLGKKEVEEKMRDLRREWRKPGMAPSESGRNARAVVSEKQSERDIEAEFRALMGMQSARSETILEKGRTETMTAGEKLRERLDKVKRIEALRASMRESSLIDKLSARMRRKMEEETEVEENCDEVDGDEDQSENEEEQCEECGEDEEEPEEGEQDVIVLK